MSRWLLALIYGTLIVGITTALMLFSDFDGLNNPAGRLDWALLVFFIGLNLLVLSPAFRPKTWSGWVTPRNALFAMIGTILLLIFLRPKGLVGTGLGVLVGSLGILLFVGWLQPRMERGVHLLVTGFRKMLTQYLGKTSTAVVMGALLLACGFWESRKWVREDMDRGQSETEAWRNVGIFAGVMLLLFGAAYVSHLRKRRKAP